MLFVMCLVVRMIRIQLLAFIASKTAKTCTIIYRRKWDCVQHEVEHAILNRRAVYIYLVHLACQYVQIFK